MADRVLLLLKRNSFQNELYGVAKSMRIGAFGPLATGTAPDQPGIFDTVSESMSHDLIFPIDDGFQPVTLKDEVSSIAFFWLLQHEAQSGIVAFVLDARKPTPSTLEADTAGFPQADTVEGSVGATGQCLSEHRIEMIGEQVGAQHAGRLVHPILRETVALP